MEIVSLVTGVLEKSHSLLTIFAVGLAIIVTYVLNSKKIDMDVITSVSKTQSENMSSLLTQNKQLADDLHRVRLQQAELHELMDVLRKQNSLMHSHIISLEGYVKHYTARCAACPNSSKDQYPDPPNMPFKFAGIE